MTRFTALEQFSDFYRSIHGYTSLIVCLVGIIMNFFNIIVLTRKHMLTSTNRILTALAISDLITMFVYIPTSLKFFCVIEHTILNNRGCGQIKLQAQNFFWTTYLLFYFLITLTLHSISIWLTVLLALYRYIYVCFNRVGKKLSTKCNTIISILIVYLSCIVLCTPAYLLMKIQKVIPIKDMNYTVWDNESEIISNSESEQFYKLVETDLDERLNGLLYRITFISQAFCMQLIPCLLLVILSGLLIHSIKVGNILSKRLKDLGKRTKEEKTSEHKSTNIMLVLVCALFVLTELPHGIMKILSIIFEQQNFHHQVYEKLGDIIDLMALLNNAVNFILYCAMSKKFRRTFQKVFCKAICVPHKNLFNRNSLSSKSNSFRLNSFRFNSNKSSNSAGHSTVASFKFNSMIEGGPRRKLLDSRIYMPVLNFNEIDSTDQTADCTKMNNTSETTDNSIKTQNDLIN